MRLKNLALAVGCLLLGGFAGYQLRSSEQSALALPARFESAPAKTHAPSGATAAEGLEEKSAGAKSASVGQPAAAVTLGERMKALLANYNADRAQKDIESFSTSDIQAALALMAAFPKSASRDSLRWYLYRAWAKSNPTAAWKAALADALESDSGFLLGAVAGELAKTNPEAAVSLALSLGMGSRRAGVFQELFDEWGKADLAGAIAYWNKHPDLPAGDDSISQVIGRVGRDDPLRAANLALTLTDQKARADAISSLVRQWAAKEPIAALSWAQTIGNSTLRENSIQDAIRGWSSKDPAAAMTQAQKIEDAGIRASAMQGAWTSWLRKDPNAAMAYLGDSKDEKLMKTLPYYFSSSTAGFTQQEKTALLDKLPESEAKQDIFRSMADAQIQKGQYNQAMELLNNVPDSSGRDRTVQQLGIKWAEADPKAAAEWLKVLPDSSDRDLATAGFATVLARTDLHAAEQWVNTIPDDGVKSSALRNIATRWLATDPAGAEAWLAGVSGLSEADKKLARMFSKSGVGVSTFYPVTVRNRR